MTLTLYNPPPDPDPQPSQLAHPHPGRHEVYRGGTGEVLQFTNLGCNTKHVVTTEKDKLPANLQNLVTRQLTGTGGAGPRPNAEQLRRFGFANSALPPAPGSPIPPPVIISRGVPVPGNRLDRNFANGSRIGYPPTPGCVSPLYC